MVEGPEIQIEPVGARSARQATGHAVLSWSAPSRSSWEPLSPDLRLRVWPSSLAPRELAFPNCVVPLVATPRQLRPTRRLLIFAILTNLVLNIGAPIVICARTQRRQRAAAEGRRRGTPDGQHQGIQRLLDSTLAPWFTTLVMNQGTRGALVFDDRSPIYQQIADKIKDDIVKGELRPDDQVMSTNQYASFYRINPATAAKGFQQLIEEGILYKKRGIGMFVSKEAPTTLRRHRQERFFEEVVDAMVTEARMIGIPLADVIKRIADAGGEGK
jgi:DNA-binding transcriptional regulator YhcF (GntR family)